MFSRHSLGPNGPKSFKENILKNSPEKKIGRTFLIAYSDLEEQIILRSTIYLSHSSIREAQSSV